jgi:hypothetical protein
MAMIASLQTARPSEGWKQFDGIRSKLARATKGVSIYSRIIRRALRGIKTASQNVLKINTATATNLTITTVLHGSVRTLNRAIGRITRRTTRLALALKDVTLRMPDNLSNPGKLSLTTVRVGDFVLNIVSRPNHLSPVIRLTF